MNQGQYTFTQIMSLVNRYEFNKCVNRYHGNRRVRQFSCWEQFLCLSFGQLTHRESLRDIVSCLEVQGPKLYHLGFKSKISRSTFSDANQSRDWRIYADFAQVVMKQASRLYKGSPHILEELDHAVYAFDSTLIRFCISVFHWATYHPTTAAVKLHVLLDVKTDLPHFAVITEGKAQDVTILKELKFKPGAFYVMDRGYWDFAQLYQIHQSLAFFVCRPRKNLKFRRQESRPKAEQPNVVFDQIGVPEYSGSRKAYPEKIRLIKSRDPETGEEILLLTNNFLLEASQIAQLYRFRWRIELFFKWIKQHLRIKIFWGESENAVKIQIWSAIAVYCLVAIAKKQHKIPHNLNEILQILSVSIFDKTPLNQLFSKIDYKKPKSENPNQLTISDMLTGH